MALLGVSILDRICAPEENLFVSGSQNCATVIQTGIIKRNVQHTMPECYMHQIFVHSIVKYICRTVAHQRRFN